MKAALGQLWRWVLQVFDLLVLARIPILMVAAGFVLALYVAQIRELFDISLSRILWAGTTFVFTTGLSLLVWYSARTLYCFEWPHWQTSTRVQTWLGARLPRLLAAAGPVIMAAAYGQADAPDGSRANYVWMVAYLTLAAALWLFTTYRRALVHRFVPAAAREPMNVEAVPQVGFYRRWHDLGKTRYFHYLGIFALVASWFIGLYFPQSIDAFGPLALILGAAAFTVWASTYPIYLAARARFPLLTGMLVWAVLMTALGWNDNHAVRVTALQQSNQDPPTGLHYDNDGRPSLAEFTRRWWRERRDECDGEVWLISSEGGGIRAAMWTVLVLSELHDKTGGRLWRCTLATSGVSGGSLGLAVFAGAYRDLDGELDRTAIDQLTRLLEADFLAPVLGAMFGVDAVQRFLPFRVFTDRGEALENAWLRAYAKYVLNTSGLAAAGSDDYLRGSLAGPLADTAFATDQAKSPLPALLLNTTVVDSGLRLIQHPFSTLYRGDLANAFPGVIDGADWLPRELPTFSAAHNSARFTFVSPAGTVQRRAGEPADGALNRMGQVVDGGYFENSATTTVQALIDRLRSASIAPDAKVRVIHISNDIGVPAFAENRFDACPPQAPVGGPTSSVVPLYGEARAPLIAILATREARGEYARQALMDQIQAVDGALWHYRLCAGKRVLPLGWTLGADSTAEMQRQRRGDGRDAAANLAASTAEVVNALAAKSRREQRRSTEADPQSGESVQTDAPEALN
jgi:hypothetical protein